jgi:hypothetical protein
MKKLIIIAVLIILCIKANAQTINWQNIIAPRGNFTFSLPAQNQLQIDSTNVLMYAATIDSVISLDVSYATGFSFDSIPDFDSMAVHQPIGTSYLHTMAQYIAFETGGTLVQLEDVAVANHPEIKSITMGVKYNMMDTSVYTYSFYRFYYWDDKLITFSTTCQQEELNSMLSSKELFFSSVVIQ